MQYIVPEYYSDFHCLAQRCQHSCCVGWEIDIDEKSAQRFAKTKGEIGKKLRQNILYTPQGASFRLDARERCPFLQADGLCSLILTLGEESLCDICRDHPRFRSFFSDRVELGLGLCCEEAARLVLTWEKPMRLLCLSETAGGEPLSVWERRLLQERETIFSILQNRNQSIAERVYALEQAYAFHLPTYTKQAWLQLFLELEPMDKAWTSLLKGAMQTSATPVIFDAEQPIEQLLCYFVYRHLPQAQDETELPAYLAFALLPLKMLSVLGVTTQAQFLEFCRLYSAEIEYSEENTQALLDRLYIENL